MLPEPGALAVFMAATIALNLTPGPDMLYVVANGVGQGRKAGVVAALGIGGGTFVHTALAALGLAAILASSPLAYDVVRYVGAAYLLYLGGRTLIERPKAGAFGGRTERGGLWRAFSRGVTTNVLNPKVALFFVAFLPQFVDPERGSAVLQFVALGTLFNLSATTVNSVVALIVGTASERLGGNPKVARVQRLFTGGVFVALGARIALVAR